VLHVCDATTCADAGQPLSDLAGRVAVVVTNPPYVPDGAIPRDPEVRLHDPKRALYGGPDGLDVVRGLLRQAAVLLRPGGTLVVEHGDEQGVDAGPDGVPGLIAAHRADAALALEQPTPEGGRLWTSVDDRPDLNHRPRFTLAVRA
jgi:methylase of polypeptide subunit release factors